MSAETQDELDEWALDYLRRQGINGEPLTWSPSIEPLLDIMVLPHALKSEKIEAIWLDTGTGNGTQTVASNVGLRVVDIHMYYELRHPSRARLLDLRASNSQGIGASNVAWSNDPLATKSVLPPSGRALWPFWRLICLHPTCRLKSASAMKGASAGSEICPSDIHCSAVADR